MKRAVLCVPDPHNYIKQLDNYSIMVVNPDSAPTRLQYLLANSDWSLLITPEGEKYREGNNYPDERVLWYTSGTTGDSKFYSFSQSQLDDLIHSIIQSYHLTNNDRYTSVMSLWHGHGQAMFWVAEYLDIERNFLTLKEIRNLPKYNPTFISAIPDILKVVGELEITSLRFIRSASSSLPNNLYTALKDKFKVPVIESFGMTEAMSHVFTNPLDNQRIGTVGLPTHGIEAMVDNKQLYIRGHRIHKDGWIDTGDLAEQDDAGYYRILGRSRDQINVKGYKLNPISIERQLLETVEGLTSCVIFGTDTVKCLYIGSCSDLDIRNALMSMGPACKPTLLKSVTELPTNTAGKVSRADLNQSIS